MRTFVFATMTACYFGFAGNGLVAEPSSILSTSPSDVEISATPIALMREVDDNGGRRCAFLGRCGSFTLIGTEGTAAYILGRDEYIADLVAAGPTITGGFTRSRATGIRRPVCGRSRRPHCGKHRVRGSQTVHGEFSRIPERGAWD